MRINLFVASATGLSRRVADEAVANGQVTINGHLARPGDQVNTDDKVAHNGKLLSLPTQTQIILLNKPVGYVSSRDGQGSNTIYILLPKELHHLKPAGRLDKDSSGLLLLTNDGQLAHQLTHPSFNKTKVYDIQLDKPLKDEDKQTIEQGVNLDDGVSRLQLQGRGKNWQVSMNEGRNRQIRRTFAALDYQVVKLHRTQFGDYHIGNLRTGSYTDKVADMGR